MIHEEILGRSAFGPLGTSPSQRRTRNPPASLDSHYRETGDQRALGDAANRPAGDVVSVKECRHEASVRCNRLA